MTFEPLCQYLGQLLQIDSYASLLTVFVCLLMEVCSFNQTKKSYLYLHLSHNGCMHLADALIQSDLQHQKFVTEPTIFSLLEKVRLGN